MGLEYSRMQGYYPALLVWLIAIAAAGTGLIIRHYGKHRAKSPYLPLASIVGSLLLIAFYSVPEIPLAEPEFPYKERSFTGESTELKRTVILPSSEAAIPRHVNAVWCSSFQLAWNELEDFFKGPILLDKGRETADLLNAGQETKADVSEPSVYARAGLIQDQVVETIQSEMRQQFGPESVPLFDDVTEEAGVVAYAYLTAGVPFKIPYFQYDEEFRFTDSEDRQASIASFGIRPEDEYAYDRLRHQVEVLFCKWDSEYNATAFAVDLCRTSSPNQIIAAMIEPPSTLQEGWQEVERRIQEQSNQGYRREFGPNDVLQVPSLFWKITHRFSELEGAGIQNTADLTIERAMQVIEFRLDRSGAKLKSESKLYCAPVPTNYFFNRPFLIIMKQREADRPFFLMWVDNAELLEGFEAEEEKDS